MASYYRCFVRFIDTSSKTEPAILLGTVMAAAGIGIGIAAPNFNRYVLGTNSDLANSITYSKFSITSSRFARALTDDEYKVIVNKGRSKEGAVRRQMFTPISGLDEE